MTKVAFVGAGSATFTRELLTDLFSYEELRGLRIALYDIDPERLETASAVARRLDGDLRAGAEITAHIERRAALDGADFVINIVQVGMHAATVADLDLPARHGLRQTIGDTLGVGGIFRALRTIPVLLGVGEDLAAVSPDAWLLNYTNPMAILCQAYAEGSPHKRIVGLCHSVQNTTRELAALCGVPFGDVSFIGAGVNHQAFILRFERDGEDLYPRLDAAIEADPELRRRVRVELYRRFGYYPTESSEHGAEYVPWFLKHARNVERYRLEPNEYVRRSEENLEEYATVRDMVARGETLPLERGFEYAPEIVHSIVTGTQRVIYGNVANGGLIAALPPQGTVEVPCLVDGSGVQPTIVRDYPPQLAALNRTFLNVADLTVRAALTGDVRHVRHAAMLDPNTAASLDLETIDAVVDELLAAHAGALPAGL
jgi:alpha-galactosidase